MQPSKVDSCMDISFLQLTSHIWPLNNIYCVKQRLNIICSVGRRLPSSATTAHTRPMSQLDDALKQFKMSTAASRENLRNSRQNLDQMEEQVCVCRVKIFALVYKNICRWRWWSAAGPPRRCWVCATTPSSARVWRICDHNSERGKSFMKLSLLTPLLWTVRVRKRNFKYWSINRLAVASINKYWLPVCPNNTWILNMEARV